MHCHTPPASTHPTPTPETILPSKIILQQTRSIKGLPLPLTELHLPQEEGSSLQHPSHDEDHTSHHDGTLSACEV